jgi:CHAT domain-containing protein
MNCLCYTQVLNALFPENTRTDLMSADLSDLARELAEDPEAGFQRFRHLFFEALERRRLHDCQVLLEVLCADPAPCFQRESRYHRAILLSEQRQFDQAEVILRDLLDADLIPDQRARVLLVLAIQLDEQAQWPEAERFYQEALTVYEAIQDNLGRAKTHNNLGITISWQVEQGYSPATRLQQALSHHQTALALAQALDKPWQVAKNWHGLGIAYSLMGQYPLALDALQKYLDLCQALDAPYTQSLALYDLAARAYMPLERWAEAAAALDEAIAILRGTDDHLNLAEALVHRGNLLVQQGQPVEALASYDEALDLAESIRTRLTAPTAQAGYRATVEFIYTAPLSLHLRQGDAVQAFTAAERARSRVLADLLGGQEARPHAEIPADVLAKRTQLHQKLDCAYAEAPPPKDLPVLEDELARLDRQIELLDPTYAGLDIVAALTAEQVRDRLPPDAALLTYAGDADDALWILAVTAAGVRAKRAPNLKVRWLRGYLADHLDGTRRGSLMPEPGTGHLSQPHLFPLLYQALLAPVWDVLQAARTVYVIPFGPLHYLPVGALTPDLTTPPPLLSKGRGVVYAPSATILLNYCHARPPSPWEGALAVAPHDEALKGLQFTLGAAEKLVHQADGLALTGDSATRQAFLEGAGRHRLVCFLGHAVFDRRYPMSSRLNLSDGSLHASEILRDLRLQADLVILSACETGRSHVLRGDEILGLSRAMLYAGTPSLLVTLWPVHEIPTRLLVEKLVEQLPHAGQPDGHFDPARALAATQRWLRALSFAEAKATLSAWGELSAAEATSHLSVLWAMTHPEQTPQSDSQLFAHPFFWSPYILVGEGNQEL